MTIEIYDSVLEGTTLTQIKEFYSSNRETFSWTTNHVFWPRYLNETSIGTVQILEFQDHLKEKIYHDLVKSNVLKKIPLQGSVLLYQWFQGSAISWHNDTRNDPGVWLGCTIYLNENWNPNWGGNFCYKETMQSDSGKFVEPKFNRAVALRKNIPHSVSITSVFAPVRTTIQIFYKDE